jgi:hypothetical protein
MSLNKKELIYPFILECCQYTEDIFWKNLFEDLAYGKAPYGTYISKNFLCCGFKNKEFSYKLERKDSEILYHELYDILKNKVGILSIDERIEKKKMINNFELSNEDYKNNWNSIRKKNIKDILFLNFAIEKQKQYGLTRKDTKYLLSMIQIFIMFKIITSKDIEYQDGKIISIKNINFENGKLSIDTSLLNKKKEFKDEYEKKDKIKPSEHWEKYLKQIVK